MNRREVLTSGLALGVLQLAGATADTPKTNGSSRAIAEGGPLTPPKDRLIEVAIAVSQGTTWIDFVGPMAVFESWHYDAAEKRHKPRFRMRLVSELLAPLGNLVPDQTFENTPRADILLIPAQRGSPALIAWIKKASHTADVTMSVCTGAAHLASAGILDGLQATSHHEYVEHLRQEFPAVKWVSGMRYVEGPRISTGGGLTAGIDLALRVTERYLGRDAAREAAKHLEYESTGWIV